jgi:ABC-type phosphate transport system substrate-binding protein
MNIKKFFATVITCVSLFGFAAIASATAPTQDINIYGSSAQFTFWKTTASTYLSNELCTGVTTSTMPCDSNHTIIQATCGGNPVNFRITSKASWDGILSVSGNTTNPNLTSEATPQTESCSGTTIVLSSPAVYCTGYDRPMIDETSCSGGTCTRTKCVPVTGGASDVQATSITQSSSGQLNGPANGGAISRNFTGAGALSVNGSVLDTTTGNALTDCKEVVVPFAFWVSTDVSSMGVQNLEQADVRLIFSGQIVDWSDLGFTAKPINVCFRHAGSGTSATLQLAELSPAKIYGLGAIVNAPNPDGSGTYSYYFNDGTGNEETCVNTLNGAVGYFDADKAQSVGPGTSYQGIAAVNFNSVPAFSGTLPAASTAGSALKGMIEKGEYDFWTVENLFEAYNNTSTTNTTDMTNLCTFLKNAGNSGVAMPDSWYAYTCQLNFMKSGDASYPVYVGSSCPQ